MQLYSPDFEPGLDLPGDLSCDNKVTMKPTLIWKIPDRKQIKSILLLIYDLDSKTPNFIHWIVPNISPSTTSTTELNINAGINQTGSTGFYPFCPPVGDPKHRYVFSVFALNVATKPLDAVPVIESLLEIIKPHIVAKQCIIGHFAR